jgi:anaerobic selenocysteine-containing dehydrogenase
VKVNNYTDKVYSPDRVLYPLRRTGPKGSGRFGRVSWDEALEEIAGRFRSSITEHGAESIMPVSYLGTEGILNGSGLVRARRGWGAAGRGLGGGGGLGGDACRQAGRGGGRAAAETGR